jgi:7-alpha-hydroxysteroid dehydrogenase
MPRACYCPPTRWRRTAIISRRRCSTTCSGPSDRAIVNLSSVFARRALPELFAYSVSCAALEQLTRSLALALANHRIRVNAIAVGGTTSRALSKALPEIEDLADALAEVTPLGRLGDTSEAAEAALFLASPAAGFVTGQILGVDGGRPLLDPLEGAAI